MDGVLRLAPSCGKNRLCFCCRGQLRGNAVARRCDLVAVEAMCPGNMGGAKIIAKQSRIEDSDFWIRKSGLPPCCIDDCFGRRGLLAGVTRAFDFVYSLYFVYSMRQLSKL